MACEEQKGPDWNLNTSLQQNNNTIRMNEKLTQLYEKIKDCTGCPTSQWSSGYKEAGWGTPGGILFLGQNPAFTSLTAVAGDSKFDHSFKSMLSDAGIFDPDYFFTNLVKFPPAKEDLNFTEAEMNHLEDHLIEEITEINPIIIVALGTPAGKWLRTLQCKADRFYLYHPSAIRYGTITREQYVHKLSEIQEIYQMLKVDKQKQLI
jgi:uracil-DNA glycosylase